MSKEITPEEKEQIAFKYLAFATIPMNIMALMPIEQQRDFEQANREFEEYFTKDEQYEVWMDYYRNRDNTTNIELSPVFKIPESPGKFELGSNPEKRLILVGRQHITNYTKLMISRGATKEDVQKVFGDCFSWEEIYDECIK